MHKWLMWIIDKISDYFFEVQIFDGVSVSIMARIPRRKWLNKAELMIFSHHLGQFPIAVTGTGEQLRWLIQELYLVTAEDDAESYAKVMACIMECTAPGQQNLNLYGFYSAHRIMKEQP